MRVELRTGVDSSRLAIERVGWCFTAAGSVRSQVIRLALPFRAVVVAGDMKERPCTADAASRSETVEARMVCNGGGEEGEAFGKRRCNSVR